MPRYSVEQSTPPLSSRLRECDQLQIAIYDWREQHKTVGAIEDAAVARDERAGVLDPGLALDRRLDEIAALRGDRHERAEPRAERNGDADKQRAGNRTHEDRGDRAGDGSLHRLVRGDSVKEGMAADGRSDEVRGGVADHGAGEGEDDEPEPEVRGVRDVPAIDRHPVAEAEADVSGAPDGERPAREALS